MNRKVIWIISITLSVLAVALILFFLLKGNNGKKTDGNSEISSITETDDGNWTSVYDATPLD